MSNERGFTLIEVLVVLGMKIILLMLIAPPMYQNLTNTTMDVFFEELKADINLVQSENYLTDDFFELTFNKKSYKIVKNSTQQLIKEKDYPKNLTVETRVFKTVKFQHNGTFKTPGRILFKEDKKTHELIFPFGKGGFYIVSS